MEKMTNQQFAAHMGRKIETMKERIDRQRAGGAAYARSSFNFNPAISAHAVAGFPRMLALPAPGEL